MAEHTYYQSKPSRKVIIIWIFTKLLLTVFLFGFIFGYILLRIFLDTKEYSRGVFPIGNIAIIIISIIIIIVFLSIIYLFFLLKTYSYKISDKGVYFTGGIIVKKQKFIPFFKITNVEASQNLIEQMLGIHKLSFQTAGTGGQPIPEIFFEGLTEIEKPKQLCYQLIERTRKSSKYDE